MLIDENYLACYIFLLAVIRTLNPKVPLFSLCTSATESYPHFQVNLIKGRECRGSPLGVRHELLSRSVVLLGNAKVRL